MTTEAVRTGNRELELGSSPSRFMAKLGTASERRALETPEELQSNFKTATAMIFASKLGYGNDSVQNGPFAEYKDSGRR